MGGGRKQRKSLPNNKLNMSNTTNTKQSTNGNDSDYGVFSDPEEMSDYELPQAALSSPTDDKENQAPIELISELFESTSPTKIVTEDEPTMNTVTVIDASLLYKAKSIETLKYKLQNDPVYSKQTTHATFFSFIILSIEIEYACSPSITRLSDISNVLRLIDYIITNHSSTSEVEEYTRNMLDMGIIEHIIRGLIDFNSSNRLVNNESIEQLKQSIMTPHPRDSEQIDEQSVAAAAPAQNSTESSEVTEVTPDNLASSAPHKTNRFIQFWRNLSCCCLCRKSRRNSIILDDKLEEKCSKQDEISMNDDDAIKNKYLAHDLP